MRWLAVALVLLGCAAQADTFPALYDVKGVADDDVLNVRSAPSADGELVGTLEPDRKDVEVVAINAAQTWAQVNIAERAGWASLTYLDRQPGQSSDTMPDLVACYGTEPFWSMDFKTENLLLSVMGESEVVLTPIATYRSANRTDRYSFIAPEVTAVVARQRCNDGMSEREFGLAIDVLFTRSDDVAHLSGCCTLQP